MEYNFDFGVIARNLDNILGGLGFGLTLAVIGLSMGVLIGVFAAFGAISKNVWLKKSVFIYASVFRNTPLLVLIFIAYFGLPGVGITMSREVAFTATLSVYAGAYMMEVFRAGLAAVPQGLIEAGQAIGLWRSQIRWSIQLPIMARNSLPSMSNYLISLFKDTSLASAIAISELTFQANKITAETFRVFEAWITVGLLYLATCYLLAFVLRRVERRFAIAS